MRIAVPKLFFSKFVFIFFMINTQFAHASSHDENLINKMFVAHGKSNVVDFILENRNGKITIQKNKSFLDVRGRPDMTLVTAKSINYDLKLLKMNISNLSPRLEKYTQNKVNKKRKKDDRLKVLNSSPEVLLSKKLKYKLNRMQLKYKEAAGDYERRRLKRELSRLERKYNDAKFTEKHGVSNDSNSRRQQSSKYKRSVRYCDRYKSQLKKLTSAAYRYKVYFCNDHASRVKNSKSCSKYGYSRRYSKQEYKNEINQARKNVSENCNS